MSHFRRARSAPPERSPAKHAGLADGYVTAGRTGFCLTPWCSGIGEAGARRHSIDEAFGATEVDGRAEEAQAGGVAQWAADRGQGLVHPALPGGE